MRKMKKMISVLISFVTAITSIALLAANAFAAAELVDINGYSCYERDGEYWTVLDGQEYLVIDLDQFIPNDAQASFNEEDCSPYSAQATTSPIGKPDGHINPNWVDLTATGGSYEDRCYLTYGDYYSPVYYFNNELNMHAIPTAKISTKVVLPNTYYLDIYVHYIDHTGGWRIMGNRKRFDFSILSPMRLLFSGTANEIIDGLALQFADDSPGQKELYYTVEVAVKNS